MVALDLFWSAFAVNAESFGLRLLVGLFARLWLVVIAKGGDVLGLDVDMTFGFNINLPSASILVPSDGKCLFSVKLTVLLEAFNDDMASDRDKLAGVVLSDGFDPMLLKPSLSPSWDDVVLFGNSPELPYFEVIDILKQFGHLVEGAVSVAGLDSEALLEFRSFGRAFAT